MKIRCLLNRNPANRCRESWALWSSFPVADMSPEYFWGNSWKQKPIALGRIWLYIKGLVYPGRTGQPEGGLDARVGGSSQ
jgi:hypothetical protein